MQQSRQTDIFSRLIDGIAFLVDIFLRVVIVVGFSALVICVVWQVFSRYVLQSPSIYTDEIARFAFIWLALIGGAYTFGQGRHLAIDILAPALSGWKRQTAQIVVLAIIAWFAGFVMMKGGGALVSRTLANGQVSPSLQMPMGFIYIAIPISGAIILFYCVQMVLRVLHGQAPVGDAPAEAGGPLD
ncbi:TRAP transporter small permease [Martelella alba]|uniref:TRAP transporter small permease protein n=1 Tax=Martelella alba TaxID=2590451 RepID=A0A506UCH0_9HYPH|nr:TRAP transporter small permease [Martelella alba]TPW32132.1 TRAP transporter small permease [Martelella alba]